MSSKFFGPLPHPLSLFKTDNIEDKVKKWSLYPKYIVADIKVMLTNERGGESRGPSDGPAVLATSYLMKLHWRSADVRAWSNSHHTGIAGRGNPAAIFAQSERHIEAGPGSYVSCSPGSFCIPTSVVFALAWRLSILINMGKTVKNKGRTKRRIRIPT